MKTEIEVLGNSNKKVTLRIPIMVYGQSKNPQDRNRYHEIPGACTRIRISDPKRLDAIVKRIQAAIISIGSQD